MTLDNASTDTVSTQAIDLLAVVGLLPRHHIVVGTTGMAVSLPGLHFGVVPAFRVVHLWSL